MKTNNLLLASVAVGVILIFGTCTTSGDKTSEGPQNFQTGQDALDGLNGNDVLGADAPIFTIYGFVLDLSLIADVAKFFDGGPSGFYKTHRDHGTLLKSSRLRKSLQTAYPIISYNPSTGYWTFTSNDTTFGIVFPLNHKIRFTPHDTVGLPNNSSSLMEYMADDGLIYADSSGIFEALTKDTLEVTGIANFRASEGNLTIDGTRHYSISTSASGLNYDISFTESYNSVVVASTNPDSYPPSGTIEFTVKFTSDIPNVSDFFVSGAVTFNGTNLVPLTFGGFNFTFNLDTGEVTAV